MISTELLIKILGTIPIIIGLLAFLYNRLSERKSNLINDLKILKELDPASKEYRLVDAHVKYRIDILYNEDKKIKIRNVWEFIFGIVMFLGLGCLAFYLYQNDHKIGFYLSVLYGLQGLALIFFSFTKLGYIGFMSRIVRSSN
jgi:hypothetical protein